MVETGLETVKGAVEEEEDTDTTFKLERERETTEVRTCVVG